MTLRCDLHIHSCLSPCGEREMTPYNLVNMAVLAGLDVIALTDHNSCRNCPAAMAVGQDIGLTVVPGMELCTSEEVHLICLFEDLDRALAFSDYVYERLPDIRNRADIFGEQTVVDERDRVLGIADKLLTAGCAVGVFEAVDTVARFGGVCYPAHIDRPSFSVLSNLGAIVPEMGFTAAELSGLADEDALLRAHPILHTLRRVKGSDAHRLESLGVSVYTLNLENRTTQAVIRCFQQKFQ